MKSAAIAFYNTENFFDITNDPEKLDNEYTPEGSLKWTEKRYLNKLWKISNTISKIGRDETGEPPLFIGLAEIENEKILKELVQSENLKNFNYGYVHFESLDERGIDNALIYRKDLIRFVGAEAIRQTYERENGRIDYSRDTLHIKFNLNNKELDVFVTHFPSRANNDEKREFRKQIMINLRNRIDEILALKPDSQIILMGDMNGNPDDPDARRILKTGRNTEISADELFNPMLDFEKKTGSLKYNNDWILFDQIILSKSFLNSGKANIQFKSAHIFQSEFIQDWDERFKGTPFRTYSGTKYLGGYSDHFPVYAIINY